VVQDQGAAISGLANELTGPQSDRKRVGTRQENARPVSDRARRRTGALAASFQGIGHE
jgi:hypothetical protein